MAPILDNSGKFQPPCYLLSPVYLNESYISERKIIKTKLVTQSKAKSFFSAII